MKKLSGLGSLSRERLSKILRVSKGIITIGLVSSELNISRTSASKLLSWWNRQGWVYRIRRGVYIPVPLESSTSDPVIEDPWIVASHLFDPCYVGGWSAAGYWDLTEQIYQSIVIITTRKNKRKKSLAIGNTEFYVKSISGNIYFGYNGIWRGQVKVNVSDPSRTIIDMLSDTNLGGGIRPIYDIFINYMKSDNRDLHTLLEYASRINNRTIFKRLGFLLETRYPEELDFINECHSQISSGYSKLDPNLKADKLIAKWKLWIPNSWRGEVRGDR